MSSDCRQSLRPADQRRIVFVEGVAAASAGRVDCAIAVLTVAARFLVGRPAFDNPNLGKSLVDGGLLISMANEVGRLVSQFSEAAARLNPSIMVSGREVGRDA